MGTSRPVTDGARETRFSEVGSGHGADSRRGQEFIKQSDLMLHLTQLGDTEHIDARTRRQRAAVSQNGSQP